MALTTAPLSICSLKALNVTPSCKKAWVTSHISKGFLKSGLSVPYFNIASLYVILGNGFEVISQSENSLKTLVITGSIALKTSSCVANAISISN